MEPSNLDTKFWTEGINYNGIQYTPAYFLELFEAGSLFLFLIWVLREAQANFPL